MQIVAFGDSLVAGEGIHDWRVNIPREKDYRFAPRLEQFLLYREHWVRVDSESVVGETTTGGLARLPGVLAKKRPAIVILALGANDMLQRVDISTVRQNLRAMLTMLRDQRIEVLLVGIKAPAEGGPYATAFNELYPELAAEFNVPLYPDFLAGVAGQAHLNLADGVHPNAYGMDVIVQAILPEVEKLVIKISSN